MIKHLKLILTISNKEWMKLRRDRLTMILMIGIPLLQFLVYGFGINVYPKHISTAIVALDESPMTRQFIQALANSDYFAIKYYLKDDKIAADYLKNNKVVYVITIPVNFTQDLIRKRHPHILAEFDASLPNALGNSLSILQTISETVYARALSGTLHYLVQTSPVVTLDVHANYNENQASLYTLVPRQIGIILVLLLTTLGSNTFTEERDSGTLETLFIAPIKPLEIICGLLLTYLTVAYVILIASFSLMLVAFKIPMYGNFVDLLIASLPFILCNIGVGLTASLIAKNNNQAQQIISIYVMLSFLFSGFMFSFDSLPPWGKFIGNMVPMTHYINITTGIVLKGYTWENIGPQLVPVLLFLLVNLFIVFLCFPKTLD